MPFSVIFTVSLIFAAAIATQSPECQNQPDGFFIASSSNARNYWLCFKNKALTFECQLGYVANEKTRSCDFNQRKLVAFDGSTVCEGQPQDTLINDPSSCGAFWVCVDFVAVPVHCTAETPNFNPDAGACQTNDVFQCSDEEEIEPDTPPTPPSEPTTTESLVATTTQQPPTNVCHGMPNGWFINDPRSCPAYFLCWNNRSISQVCQDDLPFNENEQLCDWMYECDEVFTPTTTSPITTTTTTARPDPDRNPCANQEDGYYVNDERACTAFFLCWDQVPFERNCHDDLPFNEAEQLCDWQYDCVDPIPEEVTTEKENPTTPTEDVPENDATTEPATEGTTTEESTTERVTTTEEVDTTTGEFDITTEKVDTTTVEAETTTVEVETTTEDQTPEVNCPETGNLNILVPGSCTRYWMCLSGIPHPRECAPDLHFDADLEGCNTIDEANCARDRCPIVDDPNSMVTHGHESDCAR